MNALSTTTIVLLIVGGLNWLLVGLFNMDIVASLFGDGSVLSRIVYVLVGLAAIYELWDWFARTSHRDTMAHAS